MSAGTAISLDQYLRTSFEGIDREFRDGELLQRSMPDFLHGKCQMLIGVFFMALRTRLKLYVCSETRMRLSGNRTLIPDVAVFHPSEPSLVPETPPLVAIEILSPDDRLSEVRGRLEEFRCWGVAHVWLVDPHSRRFYHCEGKLVEIDTLRIPELGIEVTPADFFDYPAN